MNGMKTASVVHLWLWTLLIGNYQESVGGGSPTCSHMWRTIIRHHLDIHVICENTHARKQHCMQFLSGEKRLGPVDDRWLGLRNYPKRASPFSFCGTSTVSRNSQPKK